jgi:hypothetical protein
MLQEQVDSFDEVEVQGGDEGWQTYAVASMS